jgi:hypothetical protein
MRIGYPCFFAAQNQATKANARFARGRCDNQRDTGEMRMLAMSKLLKIKPSERERSRWKAKAITAPRR